MASCGFADELKCFRTVVATVPTEQVTVAISNLTRSLRTPHEYSVGSHRSIWLATDERAAVPPEVLKAEGLALMGAGGL